ncbi:MAG TPA: BBP7 family outer membrane beta-barrel protein, partial [Gemmataceae bacterium]|nr:BBP7 family outer membrane beta-barrel protein [Gemmataceae bacterium]
PAMPTRVPTARVVRGAMAHFEEESAKPAAGYKPMMPTLPMLPAPTEVASPPAVQLNPMQQVQANVVEAGSKAKVIPIPAPPTLQVYGQKTPMIPAEPVIVGGPMSMTTDERVIVVDEWGNQIWDESIGWQPSRFYVLAEYLLWTTRGMHLPPLVTTSAPTVAQADAGVLGKDTTVLLYGNSYTNAGPTSGGRFMVGYSLDPCNFCMIEAGGFFLSPKHDNAAFNSNQFPYIARPFFDLNNGIPFRELTTAPNQGIPGNAAGIGFLTVDSSSQLWGAEANVRSLLWCGCNYQVTGLVGFRYLDLSDNLNIQENTLVQVGFAANPGSGEVDVKSGSIVTVNDRFSTRNRFYGGQVGGSVNWQFADRWSLIGNVKLGFGVTQQVVDIDGSQRIVPPGGGTPINFVGGLYAVPSNIGHHSQSQFGFVPEIGLKLNYQLTDNISVFVGYDFLFWSSVVRPGDQIDQFLDLNQVPQSGKPYPQAPQVRPVVPFQTSSFWAQGVNAGLMFRY